MPSMKSENPISPVFLEIAKETLGNLLFRRSDQVFMRGRVLETGANVLYVSEVEKRGISSKDGRDSRNGVFQCLLKSTRPYTLIASISPVMIGTAIASRTSPLSFWVFCFCLLFALSLQIGTNWANDYFDYIKGADNSSRKGPIRALQAGFVTARQMQFAFITMLLFAALFSLPLLVRIGWSFGFLMLTCLLLAVLYTGGRRPLGYVGLGDVFVFVFFGLVASAMTAYAQQLCFPKGIWASSLLPGSLSCAILCVNNLRDYAEDRRVGKMTLVARFGEKFGKIQYIVYLSIAALTPLLLILQSFHWTISFLWLLIPLAIQPLKIVLHCPNQLNRALELTACLQAGATILFSMIIYAHSYL